MALLQVRVRIASPCCCLLPLHNYCHRRSWGDANQSAPSGSRQSTRGLLCMRRASCTCELCNLQSGTVTSILVPAVMTASGSTSQIPAAHSRSWCNVHAIVVATPQDCSNYERHHANRCCPAQLTWLNWSRSCNACRNMVSVWLTRSSSLHCVGLETVVAGTDTYRSGVTSAGTQRMTKDTCWQLLLQALQHVLLPWFPSKVDACSAGVQGSTLMVDRQVHQLFQPAEQSADQTAVLKGPKSCQVCNPCQSTMLLPVTTYLNR